MKLRLALGVLPVLWLTACAASRPSFVPIAEQFAIETLALYPTMATSSGYHVHHGIVLDEQLEDYSPLAIERQRRFYRDSRTRLTQGIDASRLTPEDRTDYETMLAQVDLAILDLEGVQTWRHNPTLYVETIGNALYSPFVLEYADKPARYRHIIARLEKIPAFLDTARRSLIDAPETWRTVALQENDGNIGLVDRTLREGAPPDLRAGYDRAAAPALAALRSFNQFLTGDFAKEPADWRLDMMYYGAKFQLVLATDQTPEAVLEAAEHELERLRAEMFDLAMKIPGVPATGDLNTVVRAALDTIARKHATRDTYFADARRDLAETTRFVRDRDLLKLPDTSNLQVIETPEFMRGVYSVGGFNSAPPLQPGLGAFYWLTPIPASWTPERVESKLREYNLYGLKILTIHEAMPGHYVQAEYAARIHPPARRIFRALFGNGAYVEGWAVYATEMMLEEGYAAEPEMRLTFLKQMLRVVSNAILDIRLHTRNMTDQQALNLMINRTFQEREEAEGKLVRAKLSSCQLPTYYVGWRDWRRVLAAYRQAKGGEFTLKQFHESALQEGAVPLPALARLLTGRDLQ